MKRRWSTVCVGIVAAAAITVTNADVGAVSPPRDQVVADVVADSMIDCSTPGDDYVVRSGAAFLFGDEDYRSSSSTTWDVFAVDGNDDRLVRLDSSWRLEVDPEEWPDYAAIEVEVSEQVTSPTGSRSWVVRGSIFVEPAGEDCATSTTVSLDLGESTKDPVPALRSLDQTRVFDSRLESQRLLPGTPVWVAFDPAMFDVSDDDRWVIANVTVVDPVARGHLVVTPSCRYEPQQRQSHVNFQAGDIVANQVVAPVGYNYERFSNGLCLRTIAETDVIVDVNAILTSNMFPYIDDPGVYPRMLDVFAERVVDTRRSGERLRAGEIFEFVLPRRYDGDLYEMGVTAVALVVTAVNPSADGYLRVFPCGSGEPRTSDLNYRAGETRAATVIVDVDPTESVCVSSRAAVDLVIDSSAHVLGGEYSATQAARLHDSRPSGRTADGVGEATGRVRATEPVRVQIAGRGDVPADAVAAQLSVIAVRPSERGHLVVYNCDRPVPRTSTLNFRTGGVVSNHAFVELDAGGGVCLRSRSETDVVVDVNGFVGREPQFMVVAQRGCGGYVPSGFDGLKGLAYRTPAPDSVATEMHPIGGTPPYRIEIDNLPAGITATTDGNQVVLTSHHDRIGRWTMTGRYVDAAGATQSFTSSVSVVEYRPLPLTC